MKNTDENSVKLREKIGKTPFEKANEAAKKRAILAKIHAETREVLESYDRFGEISEATGIDLQTLQKFADDALIELAEAMENEFGVSA
tara:strand:+ start:364 stop:627 length:264 start_codon:yes stop_codon:yes gene_type:complete